MWHVDKDMVVESVIVETSPTSFESGRFRSARGIARVSPHSRWSELKTMPNEANGDLSLAVLGDLHIGGICMFRAFLAEVSTPLRPCA